MNQRTHRALGTLMVAVAALAAAACPRDRTRRKGPTLPAPTGVVAIPTSSREVTIQWDSVAGATTYNVYWATAPGVRKSTGFLIAGVASPYVHQDLSNGTTYYYVVSAVDSTVTVESRISAEVSATPDTEEVLDSTFGGPGYVVFGGFEPSLGQDVCMDGADRILVTGQGASPVDPGDMFIWRILEDGSLDASFAGQGWVSHDSAAGGGSSSDAGHGIAVDTSGRILVAGQSFGSVTLADMVVWRYLEDGSLDPSFDGKGWTTHHNAAGGDDNDVGRAIVLDSQGRILVAGGSWSGTDVDMAVWRILEDGSLDQSLNGQGWAVLDVAGGWNDLDTGLSIALDASGRILVTGFSAKAQNNYDVLLWRLLDNGSDDPTLGGQGWVIQGDIAGANGHDEGRSLVVDDQGRMVIAGYGWNSTDTDLAVWRLEESGLLDATFAGQGWLTHDSAAGGASLDAGADVILDRSGRILVAGFSARAFQNNDMALWRFLTDGSPDPTFNSQGWLSHDNAAGGGGYDHGAALVLDWLGRIVVAGASQDASGIEQMTVWRYR